MNKVPIIVISLILIGAAAGAGAAEFNVSTAGQLQEALTVAGQNIEDDIIYVAGGVYSTADNGASPFTYRDGSICSLTIIGKGSGLTILTGGDSTRVLDMDTTTAASDSGAVITIKKMGFRSGYAATYSAGLLIMTGDADLVVQGCAVYQNNGDRIGGIYARAYGTGSITMKNSEVSDNQGGVVRAAGATLNTESGNVYVSGCRFDNNTGTSQHGGLEAFAFTTGDVTVEKCTSTGNQGSLSGGLYIGSYYGEVVVSGNTSIDNDGGWGAGISAYAMTGSITLASNMVCLNRAAQSGGGVWVDMGSDDPPVNTLNMTGNTIYGNTAVGQQGGAYITIKGSDSVGNIYNNIVRGNTAGIGEHDLSIYDAAGSTVNLYNNDYTYLAVSDGGGLNQDGNLDVDPMFVDPAAWNFHLQKGSQLVDKGLNTAPGLALADFEGDYRVLNGDGVKPAVTDIGADERKQRFRRLKVLNPDGGETVTGGTVRTVFWGAPAKAKKFKVKYSLNGGRRWKTVARMVRRKRSCDWNVPGVGTVRSNCLIKVIAYDRYGNIIGRDISNGKFTVTPPP